MDSVGVIRSSYSYGQSIDDLISKVSNGFNLYYHYDGLGSVTGLTDMSQNIISTYKYDAFGGIFYETGTIDNNFKFTSREFEPDSNLYFYRARYYDPTTGRFLSVDPTSYRKVPILKHKSALDLNPYVYVSNNPINWKDPLGLYKIDKDCSCKRNLTIEAATITQACSKMSTCIKDGRRRTCMISKCNNLEISCKDKDCDQGTCGSANRIGSDINVCNLGGGCPGLRAMIVHELTHACGYLWIIPWPGSEKDAEACENKCFPNEATPPGSDEGGGSC